MIKSVVSVIVTTYNSASFVVETLESVKAQTWQPLELIITDDCSKDNTLDICRDWLKNNAGRFVRTELLTVQCNTGVSANCSRGIHSASTDWIKFIAGDDILLPKCIEDNMLFLQQEPDAQIIFSQVHVFRENFSSNAFVKATPAQYPDNLMHPDLTAQRQFELLLISDRIHYTPSYFFNKQAILIVGGYDKENRIQEDYPMWLKLTKAGYRLYYFHKPTVGYRMHDAALNNVASVHIFKPMFLKAHKIRQKVAHPYLPWEIVAKENYTYYIASIYQAWGLNRNTRFLSESYKICTNYLNPFFYVYLIKKRLYPEKFYNK